jgi:outer membrane protein assembly factor BamB
MHILYVFALITIYKQCVDAQQYQTGSIWPQFRRSNNGHSYLQVHRKSNTSFEWRFRTGNTISSSAAIDINGTLYFGSFDRYVYALTSKGELKWKFLTGGIGESTPAIGEDGTVYVGSTDDNLYAINSTGYMIWNYTTKGFVYSSPIISPDNVIYFGSFDNYLYAVNTDAKLKLKFSLNSLIRSSPALAADGTIYIGSLDNNLYAIHSNGTLKWTFLTGSDVNSAPAIGSDGSIYFGSRDAFFYAVKSDGLLKWQYQTGGEITASPAIDGNGIIYVGSVDSYFYAFSADGILMWRYKTDADIQSSAAIGYDGIIYVGSSDNHFYAITKNGLLKWRYYTGGDVDSSPSIASDGTIYIGSRDDYLYAIPEQRLIPEPPGCPMFFRRADGDIAYHSCEVTNIFDVDQCPKYGVGCLIFSLDLNAFQVLLIILATLACALTYTVFALGWNAGVLLSLIFSSIDVIADVLYVLTSDFFSVPMFSMCAIFCFGLPLSYIIIDFIDVFSPPTVQVEKEGQINLISSMQNHRYLMNIWSYIRRAPKALSQFLVFYIIHDGFYWKQTKLLSFQDHHFF